MWSSVSSFGAGIPPCLTAEACMARSESPKVVSRSETDPSLKVSSLTTPASVRPPPERSVGLLSRRVEVAPQVRWMAELTQLGGAPAEDEADGPIGHQPSPAADAGHEREMVGAYREPRGEAAQLDPEHHGYRLVAAEVDEHAERLVAELPHLPVAERSGHVVGRDLALTKRVLGRRRGWFLAVPRRVRDGGRVADRPHVVEAPNAPVRVRLDAALRADPGPHLARHR